MRMKWDSAMSSLVLVRLGQELGTSSDLAQSIAGVIDGCITWIARFLG